MDARRFGALLCVCAFFLSEAMQAQEARQLYTLPRVGESIDAQEARYFALFPDWPRDDTRRHKEGELRVLWESDSTLRCTWLAGDEALTDIFISTIAGEALSYYLDHIEELRSHGSVYVLRWSPDLPERLRAGMRELLDRGVLSPWWPGWSGLGEGEALHVVLKGGERVTGQLLGMTNRRLLIWKKDSVFDRRTFAGNLFLLPYGDVDSLVIRRNEIHTVGWMVTHAGLVLLSAVLLSPAPEMDPSYDQYAVVEKFFGSGLGIGLGVLGLLIPAEERCAYVPAPVGDERLDKSRLWRYMEDQPCLPPEIFAMLDSDKGERLIGGAEVPPLVEVIDPKQLEIPGGVWIGSDQLLLHTTERSGNRVCVAGGYDLVLGTVADVATLGLGVLASVGTQSVSGGAHGFLRHGALQLTAGLRWWRQPNMLHESSTGWSGWGRSYSQTSTHTQHPSIAEHYLYSEIGVDIVLRKASVGLHYLRQLSPSVTIQQEWSSYESVHGQRSGESVRSGIRMYAWAVSLRFWL
jgi:hypothetical protein